VHSFFDDGRLSCRYHCQASFALLRLACARAQFTQKSAEGSAGEPNRKPVSHCQRTVPVGLKSDFLGKHHVARDQWAFWQEAPTDRGKVIVPHYKDICGISLMKAVSFPAVTTDYVEISFGIELRSFLRRQPLAQEVYAARFTIREARSVTLTRGLDVTDVLSQRSTNMPQRESRDRADIARTISRRRAEERIVFLPQSGRRNELPLRHPTRCGQLP
jgi:hypothetical protein